MKSETHEADLDSQMYMDKYGFKTLEVAFVRDACGMYNKKPRNPSLGA